MFEILKMTMFINLQSTTLMERGGQYISCSGSSISKNFTVLEKFGFLLASTMTELWIMWPPHSTSTLGLSTVRNCTLFRSRRPQKSTSNLANQIKFWRFSLPRETRPVIAIMVVPVLNQGGSDRWRNGKDWPSICSCFLLDLRQSWKLSAVFSKLKHFKCGQQFACSWKKTCHIFDGLQRDIALPASSFPR